MTKTITFNDFTKKAYDLNEKLKIYKFSGYTAEQWENKVYVDSVRRVEISKIYRELNYYTINDLITYETSDVDEEEFYEFIEFYEKIKRDVENYLYEEDLL